MVKTTKSYEKMPTVPPQTRPRYQAVLRVLSGESTVSAMARELEMSRNHFQSIMHRGLGGLIAELGPKAPGRPAKPTRELELQRRLEILERENAQLREDVAMTRRMMTVMSDVLAGPPKRRRSRSRAGSDAIEED